MNSESTDEIVFNEYRELRPTSWSLEQKLVFVAHLVTALLVSAIQFGTGLATWFAGFGIVIPILLIVHGFAYSVFRNESWCREQMIPYMLSIVMASEFETDRYVQFHRRLARSALILGWAAILMCQMFWTVGLTVIMPFLSGGDFLSRLLSELFVYIVIFGPFVLYAFSLMFIDLILDRGLKRRYNDITHLLDIENKWSEEQKRRAKNSESAKSEDGTDN